MTSSAQRYYRRDRRRGRKDPMRGLTLTHDLGILDADVDTATVFPDVDSPVTFRTAVEVTGIAATGLIFELGGSVTGVKLAIDSGTLYFAAGESSGNGGVDGNVVLASLDEIGARLSIVAAIQPATGQARVWVNGELLIRMDAPSATVMTNGWAGNDNGSVGAAFGGTDSTLRGQAITVAPDDFVLVEPLRAAYAQVPRQFDG